MLPERIFRHPVARAVIEQRKRLTTEPERRRSIIQRLAIIATHVYGALDSTKPKEPERPTLRLVEPNDDE